MMRRLLILLTALCLLPAAVFADGADGFVRSASFAIPSAWGGQYASLLLDDRWFMEDNTQYHHGLARISLAMAVSAFRGGGGAPDAAIRAFFAQLGLDRGSGPSTWDFGAAGEDSIGTAIGFRYLTCFESPVPLVAVAVCGGNYGDEWAGNFDFGLTGDHAGFSQAADQVLARLAAFEQALGLYSDRCIYWLSGFGRGGAVCNIAAAKLQGRGGVRCYTFASPYVTVSPDTKEAAGVFNLVSAADVLCQMPPAAWGFARYGRDLYLPSALGSGQDYAQLLRQYDQVFSQFSGQSDTAGDRALAPMAAAAAQALRQAFSSRAAYRQQDQAALVSLFTGRSPGAKGSLRALSLMNAVSSAVRPWKNHPLPPVPAQASLGAFSSKELSALYSQHDPAVYASWLLALPTGEAVERNVLSDPAR